MSLIVWTMVGIAVWHFAVLVPDRFWGGTIGALGGLGLSYWYGVRRGAAQEG